MLSLSRFLLLVGSLLLVLDAVLMFANIQNPLGLPLPCPITLAVIGAGLFFFALSSNSFRQ